MTADPQPPSPSSPWWLWLPRLVAAAIMALVAYLKLTHNPADIHIFTELGVEPWGRYAAGVIEALCALLLLSPLAAAGGLLTLGVMAGAFLSHALVLGFIVQNDGGNHMILLALTVLCAATVTYVRRTEIPFLGARL